MFITKAALYVSILLLSSEPLLAPTVGVGPWHMTLFLFFGGAAVFEAMLAPRIVGEAALGPGDFDFLRQDWLAFAFTAFALIFLFSFVVSALRGGLSVKAAIFGIAKWGSFFALLLVCAARSRAHGPSALLRWTIASILVVAGLNAVFSMLGVQNPVVAGQYASADRAILLSLFGIEAVRAPLPFSGGINSAGLQMGIAVAIGVALFVTGVARSVGVALVVAGLVCVFITDSRGGLLAAIVAALLALSTPSRLLSSLRFIAAATPLLPAVLVLVLLALAGQGWVADISRGGADPVSALSGRPIIWYSVFNALLSFDPSLLIGFGPAGHVVSGISREYSLLFAADYTRPELAGSHNTVLQAILDYGYFGAFLQLLLWYGLVDRYARVARLYPHDRSSRVALAAVMYLIIAGISGETVSNSTPATTALFFGLAVNALLVSTRRSPVSSPKT